MANLIHKFRALIENENEYQVIFNQWNNILQFECPQNLRDYFWYEVYYFRNNVGEIPLRAVAQFALHVLKTAPSNVECQEVWSKTNLEMTRLRNKLAH